MENLDESFEEESGEEGPPIVNRHDFRNFGLDSEASSDDDVVLPPMSDDDGGDTEDGETPVDFEANDYVILGSKVRLPNFFELNFEPENAVYEHGDYKYSSNFASAKVFDFRWNQNIPKAGPSPSTLIANLKDPHEFVDHLFTQDITQWIVDCTNEYAQSITKSFVPTNVLEMKAWCAACIFLGIYGAPNVRTAFSSNILESVLAVQLAFSVNRFEEIRRFIHFDKISERKKDDPDKLSKIRFVFESLVKNFQAAYVCSEKVTIDEAMISYQGCTRLRQYMPNKPCKYGMKVWGLCDAKNAYFYNGEMYSGKTSETAEKGQATRVALQLVKPVTNCGRTLFTDNFYTSPELVSALQKKRTYLIGTVRPNKIGIPRELCHISYQDKKEPRIDKIFEPRAGFLWCENHRFMLAKYEIKKEKYVYLLSSKHDSPNVSFTVGNKPEVIYEYNKAKGGIDTMDMLIGHWASTLHSKRWPLRVFYWLLDATYLNAYILFKELIPAKNIYQENDRQFNFLKDASIVFLSQKIVNRANDPKIKYDSHFQKLFAVTELTHGIALGSKKDKILPNVEVESGTPLRTGRCSNSRKSVDSMDQPTTSAAAITSLQMLSSIELAVARIAKERARKNCQMEECRGKCRKTAHKCYKCKKAICVSCIQRRKGKCVYCKYC